ncbi:MarR family winged helix-turn-helix transcriptional regulator [Agromyces salentinus]|uniref:HTH marR-type domain-containing protein n=1 Tax=Agromyces salentinus TaxID=269421 RepID=A0ABN2MZY0_9MICO|nr:MarR family winged helix-turn-helix transcriptional regulator [Agromyces salentinus]
MTAPDLTPRPPRRDGSPRRGAIGDVIEGVVVLSRDLAATRRTPFAGHALGRSQLETLFLIAHAETPPTPGALAARLGLTAGAVTQILEPLRAAGLVEATTNPADARSRLLQLTEAARAEVDEFERDYIAALAPRFEILHDEELENLARLLRRLKETTWTTPPSS